MTEGKIIVTVQIVMADQIDPEIAIIITRKVNKAMEAAKGNRELAAAALSWTYGQLLAYLHEHPELTGRWTRLVEGTPPLKPQTAVDAINRECSIPVSKRPTNHHGNDPANVALTVAVGLEMSKANHRFRQGFPTLGLSSGEIDYAASLASWQGEHFLEVGSMISGGLAHTSVRVMLEIEKLSQRLKNGFEGPNAMAEEDMIRRHFNDNCETLVKMSESAQNGNLIRARVQQIKREMQKNASTKVSKAGWGAPLQAQKTEVNISGEKVSVAVTETTGTPPAPDAAAA